MRNDRWPLINKGKVRWPAPALLPGARAASVPPKQAGPDLRPPPALGEVVRVDQRFSATSVGRPQLQAQAQEKPLHLARFVPCALR